MFHMKQFIDGTLKTKRSKMYYKNELVDNYDYEDQPHEIIILVSLIVEIQIQLE